MASVGTMRAAQAIFGLVCALALLSISFLQVTAQSEHALEIGIEMTISGMDRMSAFGKTTLVFQGEQARELRNAVFETVGASTSDLLDEDDCREFLGGYAAALVGKTFWGLVINETSNYTLTTLTDIQRMTGGLLYSAYDSSDAIEFTVRFKSSGSGGSKIIQLSDGPILTFAQALWEYTGFYFSGTYAVKQRVAIVSLGSYTNQDMPDGQVDVLRTPAGTIMWYSYSGEVVPGDELHRETITYDSFSPVENPQIAFVIVFIASVMMLRMPGRRFEKYRLQHPRKFRKFAKPLLIVRVTAYVFVAVLTVLYLLPDLFSSGGDGIVLYAVYLYMLAPAMVLSQFLITKVFYDRASLEIPEDTVIEIKQAIVQSEEKQDLLCEICLRKIDLEQDLFLCPACGMKMHMECGQRAQACPSCGEILFPQMTRSIQCRSCGETFLFSGGEDPYSIQCTKCGAFQEEIKPGKNYLVVDRDPRNAYMMIRAMGLSGRPALVLTTSFPGKIRSDYGIGEEVEIRWFSDSSTDIDNIDPRDLEGEPMEISSTFLMTTKNSGLMIDGLDKLIEQNDFEKVLAFIKRLNDLAAIHGATIILALSREGLTEAQYEAISGEFDEIHDFT